MGFFSDIGDWFQDEIIDPVKETIDPILPESVKANPLAAIASIAGAPFTGGASLSGLLPFAAESGLEQLGVEIPDIIPGIVSGILSGKAILGPEGIFGGNVTLPGFGEGGAASTLLQNIKAPGFGPGGKFGPDLNKQVATVMGKPVTFEQTIQAANDGSILNWGADALKEVSKTLGIEKIFGEGGLGAGDLVKILSGVGAGISAAQSGKDFESAMRVAEEHVRGMEGRAGTEQARLESKFALSPEEREREARLFGEGGLEAERVGAARTRAGMTGEQLFSEEGPVSQELLNQILAEVKDPEKFFSSTLEQELELVRQEVNKEAQKRGVFGGLPEGGIRFEMLGRSGVDLAIKSAKEKQAARQAALSNAAAIASGAQSLSTGARGEIDQILANLQNLQAGSKQREQSGILSAASLGANERAIANQGLLNIYGAKAGKAAGERQLATEGLINVGSKLFDRGTEIPQQKPAKTLPISNIDQILADLQGRAGA